MLTPDCRPRAIDEIIAPTVTAMADEGMPYSGVLYAGLMLTEDGPKLIEYNCRFGDPECQVLMMRLEGDLWRRSCSPARKGDLAGHRTATFADDTALTVVMAAKGYPGTPKRAARSRHRTMPRRPARRSSMPAPHSRRRRAGRRMAGRVLNVTARGTSVTEAQARAYAAVDAIDFPTGFCRRDIGWREVARERG